jgi:Smg protein|tara:strand:- start:1277 stop:1738 length:462 start_codon:yes stop_codon:yes gene_type:complete
MFDLLIYMFENYLSTQNQLDFNNMTQELEAAGFDNDEIEKAFDWFSQLKLMSDKIPLSSKLKANNKLRVYTESELEKITCDGLGFILFLEQAQVLSSIEREIIIDRAMALSQNIISIDEVRWIVMMTLWNNGRENDYLFVEDALYQTELSSLH